jgi:hypothetical protein
MKDVASTRARGADRHTHAAPTRVCGTGMRPWRRHINTNRRLYD